MISFFSKVSLTASSLIFVSFASLAFASADTSKSYHDYAPADIDGHWASSDIYSAVGAEIIKGAGYDKYGNILVRPNAPVTRAEFVTMIVRALDLKEVGDGQTFSDVKSSDWFVSAVSIAASNAIVEGVGNGNFEPNRKVRRDEIASIIYRSFKDKVPAIKSSKSFKDVKSYWATEAIKGVSQRDLVTGYQDNTFKPAQSATRAESTVILLRALKKDLTGVPSNDILTNIVQTFETESIKALNAKDYDEMARVIKTYNDGSFLINNMNWIDGQINMNKRGAVVTKKISGDFNLKVTEKSNKLATVTLDGIKIKTTLTSSNDKPFSKEEEIKRTYLLKKNTSGEWKIYLVNEGIKL